ncbi:MAG: galactose oxidase, partial [Acidobacteria bacterium]
PLLAGQTATALAGNRWLLVGGQSTAGATGAVLVYDPATGARTSLPSLATPRVGHTATVLSDGGVLIVGGVGMSGDAI